MNVTSEYSPPGLCDSRHSMDSRTSGRIMAMLPASIPGQSRPFVPILKTGVLAAVLSTLFSSFAIEILAVLGRGGNSCPGVWDIAGATLFLCAITVVSCGPFGFVAGIVGGVILYLRRRRIRSEKTSVTRSRYCRLDSRLLISSV